MKPAAGHADIPLWGEPIVDDEHKRELALRNEYDLEADQYEPCCEAESDFLCEAVKRARDALGNGRALWG